MKFLKILFFGVFLSACSESKLSEGSRRDRIIDALEQHVHGFRKSRNIIILKEKGKILPLSEIATGDKFFLCTIPSVPRGERFYITKADKSFIFEELANSDLEKRFIFDQSPED